MTTTYDPFHPEYFDESDLRDEMTGRTPAHPVSLVARAYGIPSENG